jgi:hypothetical protein
LCGVPAVVPFFHCFSRLPCVVCENDVNMSVWSRAQVVLHFLLSHLFPTDAVRHRVAKAPCDWKRFVVRCCLCGVVSVYRSEGDPSCPKSFLPHSTYPAFDAVLHPGAQGVLADCR